LEPLFKHLPTGEGNSSVADLSLVSAHLWLLQQDQHTLLSSLTPHIVVQWLGCMFIQEYLF
jgi:hypothetical protein